MPKLKIGARGSQLSVAQTKQTIATLESCFPHCQFELKTYATGGDKDQKTSLTSDTVPDDFFTDALDQAVLKGEVDLAFHSAKDLPDEIHPELDWFFLPWREDRRDAILYQTSEKDLPENPVVGGASESREVYAKKRWPGCVIKPIRGNIDGRIQQLKNGDFDIILLAVAGLNRLGLDQHISEIVPLEALPTHIDQGTLAVTWKKGHEVLNQIRSVLAEPVAICGAGTGKEGNYTLATAEKLEQSTLCLHDSLMDREILSLCKGEVVHVGKRFNDEDGASEKQQSISKAMVDAARRGERVVRLKGGDPSFFARLSDEIVALNEYGIRFHVYPGVPWLCSAPVNHGIYLTERGRIRHFSVATGTDANGKAIDCEDLSQVKGPIYFFMATRQLKSLCEDLIKHGYTEDTPAAIMREDRGHENIVYGNLGNIAKAYDASSVGAPALFVIGDAATKENRFTSPAGPLHGLKVLVPGSDKTRKCLCDAIRGQDGLPVEMETFRLTANKLEAKPWVEQLNQQDWVVLASGSAAECFLEVLKFYEFDIRKLPKLAATGPSATEVLAKHGLYIDYQSDTFTSESFAESFCADQNLKGQKILVPRSSASRSSMPETLGKAGAEVTSVDLYRNDSREIEMVDDGDAILFCSPSSVDVIVAQHKEKLKQVKWIASIGPVTTKAIEKHGLKVTIEPNVYDAEHLILALCDHILWGKS